jgi:ferredoxin-NADP reductase
LQGTRGGFGAAAALPGPDLNATSRWGRWTSFETCGGPEGFRLAAIECPNEVFAQDELAELAKSIADFRANTVVWRSDPRWPGTTGNPVDLAAAKVNLLDESPDVYVCWPAPMIEAAYAALTAARVAREQIHTECFSTTA